MCMPFQKENSAVILKSIPYTATLLLKSKNRNLFQYISKDKSWLGLL
jgi:hypothetical protein